MTLSVKKTVQRANLLSVLSGLRFIIDTNRNHLLILLTTTVTKVPNPQMDLINKYS